MLIRTVLAGEAMSNQHTLQQVKILSLTLRILLVSGRVTQKDMLRTARIASAEVRIRRPPDPTAPIGLDEKPVMDGPAS